MPSTSELLAGAAVGVGATLVMDLWNLLLKRTLGIASLNLCMLGRWLGHMPEGTFRHADIRAAAKRRGECSLGWMAHYSIGVALAVGFVALVSSDWLERPTLMPALIYGVVTVAFPFLVLQPAIGLGVASSRTAHPAKARLKSLGTHLVFGVGLFAGAWIGRLVAALGA